MVDPADRTTTLGHTEGQLATITDFAGRVTTLGHDAAGRLTSITQPAPDGQGREEKHCQEPLLTRCAELLGRSPADAKPQADPVPGAEPLR